jgi:hypothetical protein
MTDTEAGEWIGGADAARILKLSPRMVQRYAVEHGRIESIKAGHKRLYRRADVIRLAAELGSENRAQLPAPAELVPIGELGGIIERQATQLAQLSHELGRTQGRLEAMQQALEAAERRAVYAEEQVKLLMAPKDEPEPPAEPERRPWWKWLWGER